MTRCISSYSSSSSSNKKNIGLTDLFQLQINNYSDIFFSSKLWIFFLWDQKKMKRKFLLSWIYIFRHFFSSILLCVRKNLATITLSKMPLICPLRHLIHLIISLLLCAQIIHFPWAHFLLIRYHSRDFGTFPTRIILIFTFNRCVSTKQITLLCTSNTHTKKCEIC